LETDRRKEQSASPNICHAGQYIRIEHKGSYVMYTTQHNAVQYGNISSHTAAL